MQWKVSAGALIFEGRIYVPEALRNQVISLFHDNPQPGHFGALRTAELGSRDFNWLRLYTMVREYVAGCKVCHRMKAPRHAQYGATMPLPPPFHPWDGVTRDFVTDLPESIKSGYTGILVVVNRLTKMAIYLPCRKDVDSPELAHRFFEHVICKHSVPNNIVTDCGTQFTSRFWTPVCYHIPIDHRLSTALVPQTDGQTKRQNQTMEQFLRAFSNYEQDNWDELLPLADFAYNNSVHASTRMRPFWAMYHRNPEMQFKAPKASHLQSEDQAGATLEGLAETHRTLCEYILEAQQRQTKYAGGIAITFNVADKVWLSTTHFQTTRPSKKLDYKRMGPYTVSKVINKHALKLDLPKTILNYNVFHVSQLDRYTPPVSAQPSSEPHPMIVDDSEDWDVDSILDSKRCYRKLDYLVQWAGYRYVRTSWEPAENLGNAQELVDEFHRSHPRKPR